MIIDTSAVVAVVLREPGYEVLEDLIGRVASVQMGSPSVLEAGMVLVGRLGLRGKTFLARFLQEKSVETIPFTDQHAEIAIDVFNRFGKGRYSASLNFGDCCSYATAYLAREPLLCIGKDFPQTDLPLVDLAE